MTAVLVVEDEALVRLGLVAELEAEGFATAEAASAEEGLALFRAQPQILAAVVDIHLSGAMDGYGLVRSIRAERPDALVVIMSGERFAPPPDFDEHVIIEHKPCDVRKIAHVLQSQLARIGHGGAPLARAATDGPDPGDSLAGR